MTKPRLLALAILALAVAAMIPVANDVWVWANYTRTTLETGCMKRLPRSGFDEDYERVYLVKRFEWLPGETVFIPNQICPGCQRGNHGNCRMKGLKDFYRCTCPDPSHGEGE